MKLNPESLARASSRHPWRTIVIWLAVLVSGGMAAGALLGPALTTDFNFTNTPEAKRADLILQEKLTGPDRATETFILASESGSVQDPAFLERVNRVLQDIAALGPGAVEAVPPRFPPAPETAADPLLSALGPFPSQEGNAVLFTVVMAGDVDTAAEHVADLEKIREGASGEGFEAYVLGQATSTEDFKKVSEEDLRFGESIGVIVALIVLVIVFGAIVAGVTPIVMGIFAIVVTLGIVALIGQLWRFSFFAPNMISMMGLAVGIDYSLFIVSRYREERARGRDRLDAIGASGATANRAVFFSGMTVVLALAGMLIVPTTIFRSLAGGAIVVVLVSVAASLTLLPALLGLLGDRINTGRIFGRKRDMEHGREGGFWDTITRGVMRRPIVSLVLSAGILIVAALPFFLQAHPEDAGRGIKSGMSGISSLPDEIPTKQAFNALITLFPRTGLDSPAQVVVLGSAEDPAIRQGISQLGALVADEPLLGTPEAPQVSPDGELTLINIPLAGEAVDTTSEDAVQIIERLRAEYVPEAFGSTGAEVLVGGETAFVKDFFDVSDRYTPWIFVLVLSLSFMLLTVVFRSIVVPIKAIILNLLSVGAAYGLIVLVFQQGDPNGSWIERSMNSVGRFVADISGFQRVSAIEAWLPLFLFSILFGLSMDYHVFLLSRIRERYDRTGDNAESVAYGLRTTGGIITGAAVIMVAVFSGFAMGRLTLLEQMGFGLAIAVLMDATIVRSILVPASMKLLGDRNWYLPRWLEWLPKVDVEGHEPGQEPVLVTEAETVPANVER